MIAHHPASDLLLDLAAGRLSWGLSLVLRTHLDSCADCRRQLRMLETVAGALIDAAEPSVLDPEALVRTLAAIDGLNPGGPGRAGSADHANDGKPTRTSRHSRARDRTGSVDPRRPSLPAGLQWPRSLRGCSIGPWRWLGPGMRMSRIRPPAGQQANAFLLRIGAGRPLAMHSHRGIELTQVLYGRFDDGRANFGPGDFDATDDQVRHQPVVTTQSECVCIAAVDGRILFDGAIARTFGRMIGL